jgi:hypothetical protein
MPSIVPSTTSHPPSLPKWERPDKTNENLDWADIKVIDLSHFDSPREKQNLAEQLRDAVSSSLVSITVTSY